MCDVSATNMADTVLLAEAERRQGVVVSSFVADVSDESQLVAFREHVATVHDTEHIDLLFNNAGIGGGGSLVRDPREEWEQVFAVCWGGVYLGTRTFLPHAARERRGSRREHEQRQRVLGDARRQRPHRLQRGEVRREGLHRGVDLRLPPERPAPAGVGRHARPHRDVDRVQLRLLLRPRPEGARRRPGRRVARPASAPRGWT